MQIVANWMEGEGEPESMYTPNALAAAGIHSAHHASSTTRLLHGVKGGRHCLVNAHQGHCAVAFFLFSTQRKGRAMFKFRVLATWGQCVTKSRAALGLLMCNSRAVLKNAMRFRKFTGKLFS
jgi:hypothetical protein